MRDFQRAKARPVVVRSLRNLAIVICCCAVLRAAAELRAGPGSALALPEGWGGAVLALELPGARYELPGIRELALQTELPMGGLDTENREEARPPIHESGAKLPTAPAPDTEEPAGTDTPAQPDAPAAPEQPSAPDASAPDTPEGGTASEEPERDAIGTTITGAGGGYTSAGEGIYIKNKTGYDIDVEGLLEKPLEFSASSGAAVLIIHTHGSEAYNPAGEDIYVPSDPSRTEDKNFNVVRVGDELEKVLTERGVTVYHNRELYDYPSYAGSYDRSLAAIKEELAAHPDIKVVIDLHRDALEGDGKLYKTVADVGDTPSAQVMLICGSNYSGLKHPDWEKNLSFALKIQNSMVTKYPTLARPLKISEYRYNQHATTGSLIAEIGTNGNTLREALTAVQYFGQSLADVLTGEG